MKNVSLETVKDCFQIMEKLFEHNDKEFDEYVVDFWERFYLETNS